MSLVILELKIGLSLMAWILDLVVLFDHLESAEDDVV